MDIHHPKPLLCSIATVLALVLVHAPGAAAADNRDELQCQIGTSQSIGKFLRDKAKCIDKCEHKAFADGEPPQCSAPYEGSLAGCVQAAEGTAGGEMQSSCAKDCPECYSGGDCPLDATARVAGAESHVETLAAEAFCDDSASPDGLTLSEHKCQRTVRKAVSYFAAAKLKCYAKCAKAEGAGKIAGASCGPPATDEKTLSCIAKAESKAAFLIDKKCDAVVNPSADSPECAPYDVRSGADWVAAEEAWVDSQAPELFCEDAAATTTTTLPPTTTTTTTMP